MTVELSGASWGAVGFAIGAALDRGAGDAVVPRGDADGEALVARLSRRRAALTRPARTLPGRTCRAAMLSAVDRGAHVDSPLGWAVVVAERHRGRRLVRDGVHVRRVLRRDGRRPRFRPRLDRARVRDHAAAVLRHGHRRRPARRPARSSPARRGRRRAAAARPRADVARRLRRRRLRHVRHRGRARRQPRHRAAVHRRQRMDRRRAGRWRSGCWRPATASARCCSSRSPSASSRTTVGAMPTSGWPSSTSS